MHTANRTLEEVDLLFASKTPWTWDEEATFKRLKAELASGKTMAEVVKGVNEDFERPEAGDTPDSVSVANGKV